ncbi:hypothetical protein [Azoarcus sp. CIB]|uniref:hypothetical protein n=1 Tax=Aromatoleum sp. (strain CIB) TaxID=198107 RepID=UPI0018DCC317|nr:hypothetical protein [Azoarcus sp. CIB]
MRRDLQIIRADGHAGPQTLPGDCAQGRRRHWYRAGNAARQVAQPSSKRNVVERRQAGIDIGEFPWESLQPGKHGKQAVSAHRLYDQPATFAMDNRFVGIEFEFVRNPDGLIPAPENTYATSFGLHGGRL